MPNSLLIVHVDIAVLPEQLDAFLAGVNLHPGEFALVEIYRDEAASAAHKDTAHYQRWRDTVAPMMARPREATRYLNTSPDDSDW